MIATTVHTTGINLDGLLANIASIIVIIGAFTAVIVRQVKRSIKDEITEVIDTEVTPILKNIQSRLDEHDTRIAHLEGVEEGKRYAVAAAGVSTSKT